MPQDTRTVRVLKHLDVTDLAGEKVMIDFESGKYFMLKGAANSIWDFLKDGATIEGIVQELLIIYNVDEAECHASTVAFLESIARLGFISIEE